MAHPVKFIILSRNPRSGKLLAVVDGDDPAIVAEYDTHSEALEAADNTTMCKAWGFEVVETYI